jgi:hypothetical protein
LAIVVVAALAGGAAFTAPSGFEADFSFITKIDTERIVATDRVSAIILFSDPILPSRVALAFVGGLTRSVPAVLFANRFGALRAAPTTLTFA